MFVSAGFDEDLTGSFVEPEDDFKGDYFQRGVFMNPFKIDSVFGPQVLSPRLLRHSMSDYLAEAACEHHPARKVRLSAGIREPQKSSFQESLKAIRRRWNEDVRRFVDKQRVLLKRVALSLCCANGVSGRDNRPTRRRKRLMRSSS